ncbi:HlyC/CorC family transporter [Microlunatus elymi]|uniref:HlyC/CorC family transporter n=1 Tax=Microlunatus elymi TaxID=2596828 RepID=A0A516PWK2_9ACTN|nr:hemolysin family protein [Microlunatus elymi]QDP95558.1 HlyC/CorC family transporter [Microlunatus elymi]
MSSDVVGLIALVVLLLINAYFVGAEFAVISARRSQIEPRAEQGSAAARTTLWAMEHATLMLATTQLGITVCSLLILNVSEPAIHHLLEIPLSAIGLPESVIDVAGFVITLALVTFLHVVFGEMVPKNLSFSVPDRAALLLAPPLVFIGRLVKPIIFALNWAANGFVKLFGVEPKDEATSAYTLEEVASIVRQSAEAGTLADEGGRISAALEFTAKTVAALVVPREQVVALPAGAAPADVQQLVASRGFSRYLITDPAGDLTGYVHLKDVLDLEDPKHAHAPVPADRIRPLIRVPQDSEAEDALRAMRSHSSHVALATSAALGTEPAGGTVTGVIFLEDVIEELVGQIEDTTNAG